MGGNKIFSKKVENFLCFGKKLGLLEVKQKSLALKPLT